MNDHGPDLHSHGWCPHRCERIPWQLALSLGDIGKQGQARHRQSLYPDIVVIEDYLVAVNQEFRANTEPVYIRPGNPLYPGQRNANMKVTGSIQVLFEPFLQNQIQRKL